MGCIQQPRWGTRSPTLPSGTPDRPFPVRATVSPSGVSCDKPHSLQCQSQSGKKNVACPRVTNDAPGGDAMGAAQTEFPPGIHVFREKQSRKGRPRGLWLGLLTQQTLVMPHPALWLRGKCVSSLFTPCGIWPSFFIY